MDNLLIRFSKNGLKENQAYLKNYLNTTISNFKNSKVRYYYKSCLNQGIEFSVTQTLAEFETKPLIQLYSLLNLVKFYILANETNRNITLAEVEKKFAAHGASEDGIDGLELRKNGTAFEFANILRQSYTPKQKIKLIDLYKRIPDFAISLKKLNLTSEKSDFKKIEYPVDYCFCDGTLFVKNFEMYRGEIDDKSDIFAKYNNFSDKTKDNDTFIASLNEDKDKFLKKLSFDINGNYYLDTNINNGFCELFVIYLIFLKYSLLSRYKPNSWYKKLQEKENVIIEYVMDNLFEKFWALITKDLCKFEKCIL